MKATLLLAGAMAPLALATAALADTPTPADLAQLKRLEGVWVSNSGYLLRAHLSGDRLALSGHAPDSQKLSETVVVGAVGRGSYEASWERWSGATKTGGTLSNLVLDTDRLSGRLADAAGATSAYVACRASDSSADLQLVPTTPLWMRPTDTRLGEGGRGAIVDVSVQHVGTGRTTLLLKSLQFTFRNDRGQIVASSDVRVRTTNGAVARDLPLNSCATESFEVAFSSVPAEAHMLDLKIGSETMARWDIVAPVQPAPTPSPPTSPPPYSPSPQDLAYLRQFEGEWRTLSGFAMQARLSADRVLFAGRQSGSDTASESFTIAAQGPNQFGGTWERRSGATLIGGGSTRFTYQPDRIYGALLEGSAGGSTFYACRVSGRADNSQLVGTSLWLRPAEVRREGDGAVVTATAQYLGGGQAMFTLAGLEFTYVDDEGRAVTSTDVHTRDSRGDPTAYLTLDLCETGTIEIVFPTVPDRAKLLKGEMGIEESGPLSLSTSAFGFAGASARPDAGANRTGPRASAGSPAAATPTTGIACRRHPLRGRRLAAIRAELVIQGRSARARSRWPLAGDSIGPQRESHQGRHGLERDRGLPDRRGWRDPRSRRQSLSGFGDRARSGPRPDPVHALDAARRHRPCPAALPEVKRVPAGPFSPEEQWRQPDHPKLPDELKPARKGISR